MRHRGQIPVRPLCDHHETRMAPVPMNIMNFMNIDSRHYPLARIVRKPRSCS